MTRMLTALSLVSLFVAGPAFGQVDGRQGAPAVARAPTVGRGWRRQARRRRNAKPATKKKTPKKTPKKAEKEAAPEAAPPK